MSGCMCVCVAQLPTAATFLCACFLHFVCLIKYRKLHICYKPPRRAGCANSFLGVDYVLYVQSVVLVCVCFLPFALAVQAVYLNRKIYVGICVYVFNTNVCVCNLRKNRYIGKRVGVGTSNRTESKPQQTGQPETNYSHRQFWYIIIGVFARHVWACVYRPPVHAACVLCACDGNDAYAIVRRWWMRLGLRFPYSN